VSRRRWAAGILCQRDQPLIQVTERAVNHL
jgi:hypothetical protein